MLTVAVWSHDRTIERVSLRTQVKTLAFSSEQELEEILRAQKPDAILITTGPEGIRSVAVLIGLKNRGVHVACPIVADVPPDKLAYEQILRVLCEKFDVRPALRGYPVDALSLEFSKLPASRVPTATGYLLSEIGPMVPTEMASIILPSIVIGASKANATAIEAVCPLKGRAIRDSLQIHGLPPLSKLLGFVTGFGVAYNGQVEKLSLTEAATRAGFDTEDSLREYLKTRTELTPGEWKRLGVGGALRLLTTRLRLGNPPQSSQN